MAEKIKCDCGITFEVEEGQTHCNYCGVKLSDIGKEKPARLVKEGKTTLSESQKKKIEEEEKYRASVRKDVEEKKKGRGCLVLIGLVIGFFILIAAISGGGEKKKPAPTPTPAKQEEAETTPKIPLSEVAKCKNYTEKTPPIFTEDAKALFSLSLLLPEFASWTAEDEREVYANIVILEGGYDKLKALIPCEMLASAHQKNLKAHQLLKESMSYLRNGIKTGDANLILKAADLMTEANNWTKEATEEMENLLKKIEQ